MKRISLALTAAAITAAGSMASAQAIAPECVSVAATAGLTQTHTVVFDAAQGACIATPIAGAAPGAGMAGGLTTNAVVGIAGVVILGVAAVSSTGGT